MHIRGKLALLLVAVACRGQSGAPASDEAEIEPSAQPVASTLESIPVGPVVVPMTGHTDGINAVEFSPDGRLIASGSMDGTIRLWSVPDGAEVATLEGHGDWVRDLAFSPDGSRLASVSHDGTLRLWTVAIASEEAVLQRLDQRIVGIDFSPDGSMLASASWDGAVHLWGVVSRTEIRSLIPDSDPWHVEFSPVGSSIAVATLSDVVLWDTQTGQEVATAHEGDGLQELAFTPDGSELAIVTLDGILLWNSTTRQTDTLRSERPRAVAFSPDGNRMVAGSLGNSVTLWDLGARQQLAELSGRMGVAWSVDYSPDGAKIVVGSWDAAVWLWDVPAAVAAYERGEMPYGVSAEALPAGVAGDCDMRFGPGGVFVGQVTDSITGLPLDSAVVRANWGCRVPTTVDGRFEIGGVDAGDSVSTYAAKDGYHLRYVAASFRVGDTTRVDFRLPPMRPCDPVARPELPRVETLGSRVVLRLTPDLEAALEAAAPGFQPLGLDAFLSFIGDSYDLECYQAPSVVIGDLNGDGVSDLYAWGVSEGSWVRLVLISGESGYEVLDRVQSPDIPTGLESYVERVEPGVYGGCCEEEPLVLTTHGILHVAVEKSSEISFYRNGAMQHYVTGD